MRKLNRALHRDLGYIFFGMTIIYSVSGIVLNHSKQGGDASIISRSEIFQYPSVTKSELNKDFIFGMMEHLELAHEDYKNYYFLTDTLLMIYIRDGHINFDLKNNSGKLVKIKKRRVLYEFNFLHYNKPKKLWTWFSDIYAVSLGLMAITGLFILKGKNGITRRGAVLVTFGLIIPAIFLYLYYWAY